MPMIFTRPHFGSPKILHQTVDTKKVFRVKREECEICGPISFGSRFRVNEITIYQKSHGISLSFHHLHEVVLYERKKTLMEVICCEKGDPILFVADAIECENEN
jgi:hypothetical protein